jgi:hypothetical protein
VSGCCCRELKALVALQLAAALGAIWSFYIKGCIHSSYIYITVLLVLMEYTLLVLMVNGTLLVLTTGANLLISFKHQLRAWLVCWLK